MARFLHPLTDALTAAGAWTPDHVEAAAAVSPLARDLTENHLQVVVLDLLLINGWRFHHETDSRRTWSGLPDVLAVRGRRLLALELKAAKGRLTGPQAAWLLDWSTAGNEAAVAGPGDIGALTAVLRRHEPVVLPPYVCHRDPATLPSMLEVMAETRAAAHRRRGGRRARSS